MMRRFAREQRGLLIEEVWHQARRAARRRDPDTIHDLRVAIRRLQQCLRAFEQFFARKDSRKLRHILKRIMKRAAEVRNRDVALRLLARAGSPAHEPLSARWAAERRKASVELAGTLNAWIGHRAPRKARSGLGA